MMDYNNFKGFTTPLASTYVSTQPKRYKHKMMVAKCVQCGDYRPGDCQCVSAQTYTWNSIRDDYREQCTLAWVAEMIEATIDRSLWWGDYLRPTITIERDEPDYNLSLWRYSFGFTYPHDSISWIVAPS